MAVVKSWFENNMTKFDTLRFSKCYGDGTKSSLDYRDIKVDIEKMRVQSNGMFIDTKSKLFHQFWKTYCYLIEESAADSDTLLYLEMFNSLELEKKPRLNDQTMDLASLIKCDVETVGLGTMGHSIYLDEFCTKLQEIGHAPGLLESGEESWSRLRSFTPQQTNNKTHLFSELERDQRFEELMNQSFIKCTLYNISPGIFCGQNIKECIKQSEIKLFIY